MSQAPPPYPGNEKAGGMPPPPNPAYPSQAGPYPQQQQYGMQPAPPPDYQTVTNLPQGGYQPPEPGYPPQTGYPQPQQGGYPQPGYQQPGGYQQPAFAHQQGPPQATTVVVTTQPRIIQRFGETAVHTQCPFCHADIVTTTTYETGTFAWLMCALMCIFGLDAGCCLIPFCCDSCKDVSHSCPNCRQVINRWSRM